MGWTMSAITKFALPSIPADMVPRRNVIDQLDGGADVPLTTVVGIPGSGRTTLLAAWANTMPADTVTWVSCDPADSRPTHLLRAIITGLCAQYPDIDRGVLRLADHPELTTSAATSALINELVALEQPVVIIIDDAHLAGDALAELNELVERLPSGCRVVVSSRRRIPLAVQRFRLRSQLCEIEPDDLAFTDADVRAYLAQRGYAVDPGQAEALTRTTGGWVGALAVVARRLDDGAGVDDVDSTRLDVLHDYVVTEVLDQQPDDVRTFLMQIATLDRLSPEECEVASDRADAAALLRRLSGRETFLLRVADDHRYRLHPMYRAFFAAEAGEHDPGGMLGLHLRLASWYEGCGDPARAIRHLIEGGHADRARALIRSTFDDLLLSRGTTAVSELADGVAGLARTDPSGTSQVVTAFSRLLEGDVTGGRRWLARAERFGPTGDDLPRARRYQAVMTGDTIAQPATTTRLGPSADVLTVFLDILERTWIDDFATVQEQYASYMRGSDHRPGGDLLILSAWSYASAVRGQFDIALDAADRAELCRDELDSPMPQAEALCLLTRGVVAYERAELEAASSALQESVGVLGVRFPAVRFLSKLALARLLLAEGRVGDVHVEMSDARLALHDTATSPLLDLAANFDVRLALYKGDPRAAAAAAEKIRSGWRRTTAVARTHLAEGNPDSALAAVNELAGPKTVRHEIDMSVLQARIWSAVGEVALAQEATDRAVRVARPGGWRLPFAEDGAAPDTRSPELSARADRPDDAGRTRRPPVDDSTHSPGDTSPVS